MRSVSDAGVTIADRFLLMSSPVHGGCGIDRLEQVRSRKGGIEYDLAVLGKVVGVPHLWAPGAPTILLILRHTY